MVTHPTAYDAFLETKRRVWTGTGRTPEAPSLPTRLYPWQAAITRWALKKERACIFADCGLGKTLMQLAWAQAIPGRVLILAPLCVAEQTVVEGARAGIDVMYALSDSDAAAGNRIVITNYERLHRFDPARYDGVVLDESSILKSFDGKTRTRLIDTFAETPYRLCCTATPSPNDIAELANHAEFLGLMTRPEFLATWFVHDDSGWRMKRHAVAPFYRWMASWAVALRLPSDLGYNDEGFRLPPLTIQDHVVASEGDNGGMLFPGMGMKGIQGRIATRRGSIERRVEALSAAMDDGDQWIAWCGLNAEADAVQKAIPGAVNVQGSDSYEDKVAAVQGFISGAIRCLVTKPKILGFGMNFQHCAKMAFMGMSDSYEAYYQCIRRCWRFGQARPVDVHIIVSEAERVVVENVRRKEADATRMALDLLTHMTPFEREEIVV